MSIIKSRSTKPEIGFWNSDLRDLSLLQRDINRMFSDFFRGDLMEDTFSVRGVFPVMDISENNESYIVKTELPGLKKEDIKITLNNNVLTISGEKKKEEEKKNENFHRIERSYGSFERSFTISGSVKSDKIDAELKDGILTIILPKTEEAKQKMVDVKVK